MDERKLMLVPMPRQVELLPGWLALPAGGQLVIHAQHVDALLGTAQRLRDAAAQVQVGLQIAVGEIGDPGVSEEI